MFRRWPVFQRMLSWTKPYTGFERGTREYQRFDWNSLLGEEEGTRSIMPHVMDGTSYFPSRPEMEKGLVTFAERAQLKIRYGCHWEGTRRADGGEFILTTTDGEYRAPVVVFAVGIAEPWRPPIPGLEGVPHYGELRPVESYADRRVFIIGKQNSGFEIASGLLPWARQIVLASPSPTRLSVDTHSLVGVRARYVQPYEDYVLAGGVLVLDASIEGVEKSSSGFRVKTRLPAADRALDFDVDDVIAATGFTAPLRDLSALGVKTFGQSKLPVQTSYWESADVPGIYFAGTITQGSKGMLKHGIPSNSGAVQGHRYNARVLARRLANTDSSRPIEPQRLVDFLLDEATFGPELWHQRSYLARVVHVGEGGLVDKDIVPLAHFVDHLDAPDAVAVVLESNGHDDLYPVVYVRRAGTLKEFPMPPHPVHDYRGEEYRDEVTSALAPLLSPSLTKASP
jgi:thioredoxin reductase